MRWRCELSCGTFLPTACNDESRLKQWAQGRANEKHKEADDRIVCARNTNVGPMRCRETSFVSNDLGTTRRLIIRCVPRRSVAKYHDSLITSSGDLLQEEIV